MFFKRKCPKCGAKNPKGNIGCAKCGHLLAVSPIDKKLSAKEGSIPVELKRAEEELEITCPICGTQYQASYDEDAIICPNLDCRAVPKTSRYGETVVVKEKATIKTPEGAKDVDCYIKGGHITVDLKDPLTIPLRKILVFEVHGPYISPSKNRADICRGRFSPVLIRYLDHSGRKHWLEFRMDMLQALSMRDCWFKAKCWFDRLQVDSANVFGKKPEKIEMSIFGKVKEAFRSSFDYEREKLCINLHELGINAQIEMRGWAAEADIGNGHSNGVIDIPEGPIRWVNHKLVGENGDYIQFGVPDPRLRPDAPEMKIKTASVRRFKLVGKVEDFRWKGKDLGVRIIERMSSDISLKQLIKKSGVLPIYINAYGDFRCWIINTRDSFGVISLTLTAEKWSCYQAIARHLLAEWAVE